MTKNERLLAALAGEPVDRPPVSIWRHFYPDEVTRDGLAAAMLDFQKEFDWDFMKVNPRAVYHVEDWGNTYEFSTETDKNHVLKSHRIQSPEDWKDLSELPSDQGVLGQHLDCLRQIGEGLGGEVPFIMTVFNPISIAGHLAGGAESLMKHIESDPEALHRGLEVITATFIRYARACIDAGVTGFFFPTTSYATSDLMTFEQYNEFGRSYDLQFLESVQDAGFLLLHVCGSNCFLTELLDYPAHAVNWSTEDPTTPSMKDIAAQTEMALIGGVNQGEAVTSSSAGQALEQARAAREAVPGNRFILGAGCTVPHSVNNDTLHALRKAAEEMA